MNNDEVGAIIADEENERMIEAAKASESELSDLLADGGLKIQVRLENFRSQATDEYESYLVIRAKGKTQPYLYIPDGFDDDVLDAIIERIKTGNGKSY